jgi:hypothetical protein
MFLRCSSRKKDGKEHRCAPFKPLKNKLDSRRFSGLSRSRRCDDANRQPSQGRLRVAFEQRDDDIKTLHTDMSSDHTL